MAISWHRYIPMFLNNCDGELPAAFELFELYSILSQSYWPAATAICCRNLSHDVLQVPSYSFTIRWTKRVLWCYRMAAKNTSQKSLMTCNFTSRPSFVKTKQSNDRCAIDFSAYNVILEHCWHINFWKLILGHYDQKTCLRTFLITDNKQLLFDCSHCSSYLQMYKSYVVFLHGKNAK